MPLQSDAKNLIPINTIYTNLNLETNENLFIAYIGIGANL